MIPSELLTLLTSSTLASGFKIWSQWMKGKRDERLATVMALQRRYENTSNNNAVKDKQGMQWTRRIIALIAVFFIIALPKIIACFRPDIVVHIGYTEMSQGFWFFTSSLEKVKWVHLQGLVITPLDTHLLSAIIGLYFGSSIINNI